MDARVKPAHDESRITAVGITFYLYDSSGSGPSLNFGGMDTMNETSAPAATVDRPAVAGKIGVLLVKLGTPEAAEAASVRQDLKEFLEEPTRTEHSVARWQLWSSGRNQ